MISDDALETAWKKALKYWGLAIQTDRPRLDPKVEALAFIDLSSRQVTVNPARLADLKAEDCLEAVLTHELGHHLRYPHTLGTAARLELFERELIPLRGDSLQNLFTDTLIHLDLGATPHLRDQIVRIFQAMTLPRDAALSDAPFLFYLTVLEEAFGLAPRALTREAGEAFEVTFPGCRAEAQLMAQELPNLAPNIFTQFLYFASVVSRYQLQGEMQTLWTSRDPLRGDYGRPDAGDYADALRRGALENDAVNEAVKKGWLKKANVPDAASSERIRTAAMPGILSGEPKKLAEAMALHYRRLAERYLVKPPPSKTSGEPIIPSTLSPWDFGDAPNAIDWLASVLASGAELGAAQPLKRDLIEDEPSESPTDARVRLEIYLDVSGSMPDPKGALNPMTLAAQVLCFSALRHGGQARALIYSGNCVKHWQWTRSEEVISRFLMEYIGGGTVFPFGVLAASVAECQRAQPVRVALTDGDFLSNLAAKGQAPILRRAAASAPFVVLMNGFDDSPASRKALEPIAREGARPLGVVDLQRFPAVAAALGEALFGKPGNPGGRP